MSKIKNFFNRIFPNKRKLIQLYAALLYNAQLSGFISGNIYTGPLKHLCVPGMNCYSCPGAVGACPLGSLQNELAASKTKAPTYVLGIILLYCILFGRWICGWLCPGGLLQELLYKIKTPKLRKNRVTRILSYFKYVLLVVLVICVPLMFGLASNKTVPAFCKYVCPIGTFEGAVFLLGNSANVSFFDMLGPLFTWKFCLLIGFIVGSIFIYRFFCRFFCPLGAIYGLFNKLSIIGIKVDKSKCNNCGACVSKCKMDVKQVGDHECIQCGECIDVCNQCAIKWKLVGDKLKEEAKGSNESVTEASNENAEALSEEAFSEQEAQIDLIETNEATDNNEQKRIKPKKKLNKRSLYQIIVGSAMLIFLVLVVVFTNINWSKHINVNEKVGDFKLELYEGLNEKESFNIKVDNHLTIIYFYDEFDTNSFTELAKINERLAGAKYDMIAVSSYAKKDENEAKLKEANISNILLGYDDKNSNKLSLFNKEETYPYYVWISSDNVLNYSSNSFFSETEIEKIELSLAGTIIGNKEGNYCFTKDLTEFNPATLDDIGTFNLENNHGKITILNFWYTECGPCVTEIPEFNKVVTKYSNDVELVLVHAGSMYQDYIKNGKLANLLHTDDKFKNLNARFVYDDVDDSYYYSLGGRGSFPMSIIVDENGYVIKNVQGPMTEAELEAVIVEALNK